MTAAVLGRRRVPLRTALAAAAAALTVTGAVIALGWHGPPRGASPAGPPAAGASTPAGNASPAAPQLPKVNLAGLAWRSFHGIRLPSSPSAGPRGTAGGTASGFTGTPLGALLAAVNIGVRANAQWGPAVFGPEIRDSVTGPSAAQLLAQCQSGYTAQAKADGAVGGQPLGDVTVTEKAFRWIAYSQTVAVLDLAVAGPGSQGGTVMASVQLEVIWEHGDWRLAAPPGGDFGNSAATLTSLAGYTAFPGQG